MVNADDDDDDKSINLILFIFVKQSGVEFGRFLIVTFCLVR